MSIGLHVWDDMLDLFFPGEDRVKIEWAIGCALSGGPAITLDITGEPATGKSTILMIAQEIFDENCSAGSVGIHHDGSKDLPDTDFTFVTEIHPNTALSGTVLRVRSSGEKIPFESYGPLVDSAKCAHAEIADQCKHMYRELGADYYNQEEVTK